MTTKRAERELLEELYEDLKLARVVCADEGCGKCEEFNCSHTLGGYGVRSYRWVLHGRALRWLKAKIQKRKTSEKKA